MRGRFSCVSTLVSMTVSAILCSVPVASVAATPATELPVQSLAESIRAVARLKSVNILVDPRLVEGRRAPALRTDLGLEELIRTLLAGTNLQYQFTDERTIVIAPRPAPAAQPVQAPAPATINSTPSGDDVAPAAGTGAITGQVIDGATRKRLAGVLMRIDRTGETTVTDERGEYRFSKVPAGTFTVSVHPLGYGTYEANVDVRPGESATLDFSVSFGSEAISGEVTVYGTQSARALALNQERAAENSSTVISADLLGNFTGNTLSDALRRAPGVSFQQDELTGDGTNIIVRGLAPDYNQVKLNGVALLDSGGVGRSARLSNILADSVSQITISKTLLPNQDSAGTGGLIEIETKSPLDRPRRYANLSVESTRRGSGFGSDFMGSATFSGKFGEAEHVGIGTSVQYRKQDVSSFSYAVPGGAYFAGPYLPLGPTGRPADLSEIDPRTSFPFEQGVDSYYLNSVANRFNRVQGDTLTLTLDGEWLPTEQSSLRLDYLHSNKTVDRFSNNLSVGGSAEYSLHPVSALGGEVRYVLTDAATRIRSSLNASLDKDAEDVTDSLSLRGNATPGRWNLDFTLGYTQGRSHLPENYFVSVALPLISVNPSLFQPGVTDATTGLFSSLYGKRTGDAYPLPLLNQAGFDLINSPDNISYQSTTVNENMRGRSTAYSGNFSGRYDFDWKHLRYLQAGAQYDSSRFSNRQDDLTQYAGTLDANRRRPSAASVGLGFASIPFSEVTGSAESLRMIDVGSFYSHIANLPGLLANPNIRYFRDPGLALNGRTSTREQSLAPWVQGRADVGKLEIIGGARMSRVEVHATIGNSVTYSDENFVVDEELLRRTTTLIPAQGTQTDILPRVLANYRATDNLIFRGGFYATVARPQIGLLSDSQVVTLSMAPFFGPTMDRPGLIAQRGNPNLKPARTGNFDLGAEYYSRNVGVLKLSGFYKRIENLLENNRTGEADLSQIELPDDPRFRAPNLPQNLYVEINTPVNNPDAAHVWGLEAAIERSLDFLPKMFTGLGTYINYAYSHSAKNTPDSWSKPIYDAAGNISGYVLEPYVYQGVSFEQSPRHSGTIGLTYSAHGVDASLMYSYQARRKITTARWALDDYNDAVDSLDLRAEYRFRWSGSDLVVSLEGANLLKGRMDANTETSIGRNESIQIGGTFLGGRSVKFGVAATF